MKLSYLFLSLAFTQFAWGPDFAIYHYPPLEEVKARKLPLDELKKMILPGATRVFLESPEREIAALRNYVASLLALYPKDRILFRARDGEILYDIAMGFFPEEKTRFSLINLGREHVMKRDETADSKHKPYANLPDTHSRYLKQLGVLDGRGSQVVMADIGKNGSIEEAIVHYYPSAAPKAHFLQSFKSSIPGSTAYSETLSGGATYSGLTPYHLELLPHATLASEQLGEINGSIVPLAEPSPPEIIESARKIREHIKFYIERNKQIEPDISQRVLAAMQTLKLATQSASPSRREINRARAELAKQRIFHFEEEIRNAENLNSPPKGRFEKILEPCLRVIRAMRRAARY